MVAQTEKRLALVIGNSNYQYLSKLPNPVGDALLIAETLDSLGFEIMLDTNITTKRNEKRNEMQLGWSNSMTYSHVFRVTFSAEK